jgi:predicted nucleic acid-binding protein
MEPASLGVVLDSSVVIEAERQRLDVGRFLKHARRAFLDDLKATVPVYPITGETAELVGKLNAESLQKGITIPFDDLLIGVCALERGYAIATRNMRHF